MQSNQKIFYRFGILMKSLFLLTMMVGTSFAATVTNTNDSGAGSLRAALANYAADPNITFNIPANSTGCTGVVCTITLSSTLTLSTFSATTVSINGAGPNVITINGNGNRVFNITAGGTSFNFNWLTITGGVSTQGSGINFAGSNLTISNSTLSNNSTTTGNGQGGGLYAAGGTNVTISNSTFSTNHADGGGANAGGGGIYFIGSNLNILNSTFSANTAVGGKGGALFIANNTSGELVNDTFTLNSASSNSGRGGAIYKDSGNLALRNTIVGNNTTGGQGPDIFSVNTAPVTRGNNLIGNTSGSGLVTPATGDNFNVAPQLGPLSNSGGPTQTHPLTGGVAIDGGNNCVVTNTCVPPLPFALTTDQRGFARQVNTNVDIGAFEVQASTAATITISGQVMLPNDIGLTNALVTITDSHGASQTILTGKRGSFQFKDVLAGETYVLTVSARRYAFAPQVVNPTESLSGLIITPLQ